MRLELLKHEGHYNCEKAGGHHVSQNQGRVVRIRERYSPMSVIKFEHT